MEKIKLITQKFLCSVLGIHNWIYSRTGSNYRICRRCSISQKRKYNFGHGWDEWADLQYKLKYRDMKTKQLQKELVSFAEKWNEWNAGKRGVIHYVDIRKYIKEVIEKR